VRYKLYALGQLVSEHSIERRAKEAATRLARQSGLVDDGICSGDEGWPSIKDTQTDRWVDYPAPVA
jgi:hypothetical protein